MEARIAGIVRGMTLEQKIGQMTSGGHPLDHAGRSAPPLHRIGPQRRQRLAGMRKDAAVTDWTALSDAYYRASMATDMAVRVPVIWGTDAVHGHGNVAGATLFPHNIGLGRRARSRAGRADRPRHRPPGARHRHLLGVRAHAGSGREPPLGPHL